jgi:hypothetical protein
MKSMYIEYIIYNFSVGIGLHVYDSWNISKQKKIEKLMQCPSIKSPPLWYGSGFSPKNKILLCIYYLTNEKKKLNAISSKKFQFLNCLRFNWCISISYTIKKSTQEFHPQP